MDYGLLPEGFVAKPLEQILQDLQDDIRAIPGLENLGFSAESVEGKQVGAFGSHLRELWELGQAVYNGFDPSQAIGAQQDAVNALRGVPRLSASKGKVVLRLTLAPGASVLTGKAVAQVLGQPANRWVSTQTASNPGASIVTVDVEGEAEFTGPVSASAGTISVIAAPAVGWTAVTNPLDAVPGRDIETNAEYRARAELQQPGTSTLEATITAIRNVPGVQRVFGFENIHDFVDVDGLPPHSIELVVQGGTDLDVATTIWKSKGGGVATHSSNTVPTSLGIVDTNGQSRTIRWTRPILRSAYVTYTLVKTTEYPGDAAFKAAIAAWADTHVGAGGTLKYADLVCQGKDQPGVDDAAVTLGFAALPTAQLNLIALPRQIIDVDTSRIVVTP